MTEHKKNGFQEFANSTERKCSKETRVTRASQPLRGIGFESCGSRWKVQLQEVVINLSKMWVAVSSSCVGVKDCKWSC